MSKMIIKKVDQKLRSLKIQSTNFFHNLTYDFEVLYFSDFFKSEFTTKE